MKRNGRNSLGPNLYGVVDRAVASQDGYNYSAAMQSLGGVWSTDRLDAYLEAPLSYVPGTSMTRATPDGQERADIIAYLASLQVDE